VRSESETKPRWSLRSPAEAVQLHRDHAIAGVLLGGIQVHLTESCEQATPHLITHVETTPAPAADGEVTTRIHEALAQEGLLPSTHLVDTGHVDAPTLAAKRVCPRGKELAPELLMDRQPGK
jgi:hypothetical protein